MHIFQIIFLCFLFSICLPISGNSLSSITQIEQDSLSPTAKKIVPLPIFYRTPETGSAFGGGAIMTFRFAGQTESTLRSQLQVAFIYTLRKQILAYMPFELYFKNGDLRMFGEIGYFKYVYPYFGVGANILAEDEEFFSVNFPRIEYNLVRRIKPNLFAGIQFYADDFDIVERDINGELIKDEVLGSEGGLISGLGVIGIYDTRDNNFFPKKGYYLEAYLQNYNNAIGSDFQFSIARVDARKYFDLGGDKVIALNAYARYSFGDIPFFALAQMGGSRRMRGYTKGQYRDEHFVTLQSEYRFPIYWRFGGVLFGGVGSIGGSGDGFEKIFPSVGLGMRFKVLKDDNLNLRIDWALGKESSGFYLTFGEAF